MSNPDLPSSRPRIAIVGGGLAGLTAAWQLAKLDPTLDVTLFEASSRLGGTVETVHRDGFTIELGPDGWVSEKPWAAELARDLGLADQLTPSNDATRVTWILRDGRLQALPDGMRMMVPTDLSALHASPLFSPDAIRSYQSEPQRATELLASAPEQDESIASFVLRHFGREVLDSIAAPLLSGVFGGDVHTLSVRAIMPQFVALERNQGSLIRALQLRPPASQAIFTTLRSGTQTLIDRMTASIPPHWLRLDCPVGSVNQQRSGCWTLGLPDASAASSKEWDQLVLATPAHITARLLPPIAPLLPRQSSSAIIAAYAFDCDFDLPAGFGFLVPYTEPNTLLAATFVDQKYPHRAPAGKRLLRAFFGGKNEPANDSRSDEHLALEAFDDLQQILGPLPAPAFTVVRRWPRSLPQYAVGHLDRIAELDELVAIDYPTLTLLGNPYRGVGLPDLIRDAREAARRLAK